MHEAKTHLSRLVDQAMAGESFIIAKAGQPMVLVTAINAAQLQPKVGFLTEGVMIPDDFDSMGSGEIEKQCHGTTHADPA